VPPFFKFLDVQLEPGVSRAFVVFSLFFGLRHRCVLSSAKAMPQPPRAEAMIRRCELLPDQAAVLSKGERFQFYAAALPEDVLDAAIEGALALRQNNFEHEYSSLIYRIGLDVRYMLYDDALNFDIHSRAQEWALVVGLALVLERIRRRGKIDDVPTDPFSRAQMAMALGRAAEELSDLG